MSGGGVYFIAEEFYVASYGSFFFNIYIFKYFTLAFYLLFCLLPTPAGFEGRKGDKHVAKGGLMLSLA